MKYTAYITYNLIILFLTLCVFVLANTYYNALLIPDSLRWKNGALRSNLTGLAIAQAIILLIEAAAISWGVYKINMLFLSTSMEVRDSKTIAARTAKIQMVLFVLFIGITTYLNCR